MNQGVESLQLEVMNRTTMKTRMIAALMNLFFSFFSSFKIFTNEKANGKLFSIVKRFMDDF